MRAELAISRESRYALELMPKILLLVTRNQRRGAESFASVLVDELNARGFDARLRSLAPAGDEATKHSMESLGRTPLSLGTLRKLRREILLSDLVIACGSKTLPASVIAGARTRKPVIYQNIGDPLFWAGTLLRRLRVRYLLRSTAAVAALTDQSASILKSQFGVAATRLRVIRNARSSDVFRPPTAQERTKARRSLGVGESNRVIVVAGALSAEKRVDVAIRLVQQLDPDVRLVVAGDGPLRAGLEQLAETTVPGRVLFLGPVLGMSELLWACDLVLLTSASEGVPGVLIEAGLTGLPVVATDVGFIRDVVIHGETGYLVQSGEQGLMAEMVARGLEEAEELGRNGRIHCADRYDLARVCDEWASFLWHVLRRDA